MQTWMVQLVCAGLVFEDLEGEVDGVEQDQVRQLKNEFRGCSPTGDVWGIFVVKD